MSALTSRPRPDWTPALGVLRACRAELAAPERAYVDQVEASVRDTFLNAGIDLNDEWTLHALVTMTTYLTSQVIALTELGVICPASSAGFRAAVRGNYFLFAEYLPADIAVLLAGGGPA